MVQGGALSGGRLVDRMVFADIGDPDAFGMAFASDLERTYGAHWIARCMLPVDGETWITRLADD